MQPFTITCWALVRDGRVLDRPEYPGCPQTYTNREWAEAAGRRLGHCTIVECTVTIEEVVRPFIQEADRVTR